MNILTFDIEDWFHILDNPSTKTEIQWNNFESRIHRNMDKIHNLLSEKNLKATFFVVGWVAKKFPEIVKKIDNNGYEIGSHTHMHQLLYNQTKNQVDSDLKRSIDTIQNITGKKVKYFRAPGFSIVEKNKWVFDILINNGIEIDCSIFPSKRSHGGYQKFGKAQPCIINYDGKKIKEFPINTCKILNFNWVFSGGGYFRLTPRLFINSWTKRSNYVMTYFHPRDFDPNQPVIKDLSMVRRFKSYVGLKYSLKKLSKWLDEFEFIDLTTANDIIDWNSVPVIKI